MKINFITSTNGNGWWGEPKDNIVLYKAHLHESTLRFSRSPDDSFGELRIFFKKKTWNINKNGLIYTDVGWLKQLKNHFIQIGFSKKATKCISYSEQGMQGDNYVSLDAWGAFIKEWNDKYE